MSIHMRARMHDEDGEVGEQWCAHILGVAVGEYWGGHEQLGLVGEQGGLAVAGRQDMVRQVVGKDRDDEGDDIVGQV